MGEFEVATGAVETPERAGDEIPTPLGHWLPLVKTPAVRRPSRGTGLILAFKGGSRRTGDMHNHSIDEPDEPIPLSTSRDRRRGRNTARRPVFADWIPDTACRVRAFFDRMSPKPSGAFGFRLPQRAFAGPVTYTNGPIGPCPPGRVACSDRSLADDQELAVTSWFAGVGTSQTFQR